MDETFRIVDHDDQDFAIYTVTDEGEEGQEIEPFADVEDVIDFIDEHPLATYEIEHYGKIIFDGMTAEDAKEEVEQR